MIGKDWIISEIKRTAVENEGVPLGIRKFHKVTDIKKSDWYGKYWRNWSEALKDAGFLENEFSKAHDKDFLLNCLAKFTLENKHFPTEPELMISRANDDNIPSPNSFRNQLGTKSDQIQLLRQYAIKHEAYTDILQFLPVSDMNEVPDRSKMVKTANKDGFVYLAVLKIDTKKRYKIGRTNLVERRRNELSFQLPEKLELVHYIETDDMSGIEAYWHKRFADKNTNGEWFDLSIEDIRVFKRRKFM